MQKLKFKKGDKVRRLPKEESVLWLAQAGVKPNAELIVNECDYDYITFSNAQGMWSPSYFELVPESAHDQKTPSDYLRQAADTLDERGKQYDASGSERSMAKTVAIFNILTKNSLTVAEGWQFMKVLKEVRLWSNTDVAHVDSIVDNLGYTALLAEETISLGGKLKANNTND